MAVSDTREALRSAVRAYTERASSVTRARALQSGAEAFDRGAWRALAGLGCLGVLVPERYGGLGLGAAAMTAVAGECARALVPEPLAACAVLASRVIALGDNESLRARLLSALVEGTLVPAVAWQEAIGGIEPASIRTRAIPEGSGVRLAGTKRFVVAGAAADGFVVSAQAQDGIGLYWIARDCAGLAYEPRRRADGSEHGTLALRDVRVTAEAIVTVPGRGAAVLSRAVNEATVVAAAELVAVAERALEITLEHLRTRTQFGKPIGSFQALQHRAVDLYIQKELGVSAVEAAVAALEDPAREVEVPRLASRAKSRASDAALAVTQQAVQMHGAIGFTDECDIGLYLKRALVLAAWLGNGQAHRRRIGIADASAELPAE